MLQLPQLYSNHLKQQFNCPQYLIVSILINLLQNLKTVKLGELARRFPYPIQCPSRIKKLQRFLSLEVFQVPTLWFPMIGTWLEKPWQPRETLYLVIDRSQWRGINLLMVSFVYQGRGIPLNFKLLPELGNSNLTQQQQVLEPVLELLKDDQIVVLGDREFCNVDLGKWLSEQPKVSFSQ